MTVFRQMYDEWAADLRAKGFGGVIDQTCDYKNGGHTPLEPTPSQKNKSLNTVSNTQNKNERAANGIGGPSSPCYRGEIIALSN